MRRARSGVLTLLLSAGLALPAAAQSFHLDSVCVGGDGGTDYLTADPGGNRVFVSRGTHVMVLDSRTGQVVGDIPDTPRVHGVALVPEVGKGFTTNGGDSTVSVFDLQTLAVERRIKVPEGGLDGIMYDEHARRIVLTNHSRPRGTVVTIDPASGALTGSAVLEDDSPEGAASDGAARLFVNNEGTSTMQVLDASTLAIEASWPLAPCEGPTGIAFDRQAQRIFVGCSDTSVVLDAKDGRIVARIPNGAGVDALGWDAAERLLYIPAGRSATVTVVHQDTPDRYRVLATIPTVPGAKTISVNQRTHVAYLFQPVYGPAPAAAPGAPPAAPGGRPPRGPVIGAWFLMLRH